MKTTLLPLLLLTTACGSFVPNEGTWTVDSIETVENACELEMDTTSGKTMTLGYIDDGFTLTPDEDDPLSCILDGKNFDCDVEDEAMDQSDADFVISFDFTISGSFSSETAMEMTTKVDISCEGEDCDEYQEMSGQTIPCSSSNKGSLSFTE